MKGFGFQAIFLFLCNSVVCEFFNCLISQDPWIKEDGSLEEIVVSFDWPEVETGFEVKLRFEEAFNAWKV